MTNHRGNRPGARQRHDQLDNVLLPVGGAVYGYSTCIGRVGHGCDERPREVRYLDGYTSSMNSY